MHGVSRIHYRLFTIDYYTGFNIVLRYLRPTEGEPTSFRRSLVHVVNLEVQLDGTLRSPQWYVIALLREIQYQPDW